MWTKSYSIVTNEVTKEQMWKLFSDVNNWHNWDKGIDYAKIDGKFEKGNHFELKPKGGPQVKIQLVETIENQKFVDLTTFPFAKMWGEHTFEETTKGLKITTTMKVKGMLSFLWIKLVAKNIADGLKDEIPEQIKFASKL